MSSPCWRLGSCVARKIIAIGTSATPTAVRIGGVSPLAGSRRLVSALNTVPRPITTNVIVSDAVGVTGAGLVGAGDERHERGRREHGAVDDPEDHGGAVGDRHLGISGRTVHDVGIAGIERDDHDAGRGHEDQQVDDHHRCERDTLVDVEDGGRDEQHDERQQLRHLVADVGDDLLVDACGRSVPR